MGLNETKWRGRTCKIVLGYCRSSLEHSITFHKREMVSGLCDTCYSSKQRRMSSIQRSKSSADQNASFRNTYSCIEYHSYALMHWYTLDTIRIYFYTIYVQLVHRLGAVHRHSIYCFMYFSNMFLMSVRYFRLLQYRETLHKHTSDARTPTNSTNQHLHVN